ncbi:MAG: hypothetical protein ACXVII_32960, partial [Solirubrobacteraceae bacterium]
MNVHTVITPPLKSALVSILRVTRSTSLGILLLVDRKRDAAIMHCGHGPRCVSRGSRRSTLGSAEMRCTLLQPHPPISAL